MYQSSEISLGVIFSRTLSGNEKKWCDRKKVSSIKVMVAFGQQTFDLLDGEAKERGVTVQELLRAVIIPDWFRTHGELLTKITMPEAKRRIHPLTKTEPSLDQDQGSKFHSNRLYLV